jgi:WD40 repeat protein
MSEPDAVERAPSVHVDANEADGNLAVSFPEGFAYAPDHDDVRRAYAPGQLRHEFTKLHCSFGFPCARRYNLHYVDEGVVLFACGNTVQILDLLTHRKDVLRGHGSGVGTVAVHPSRKFFAVGEVGVKPNVYVYEYPSLRIIRILRLGTEKQYSYVQFSHTGDLLATVGGAPDFLLTVWDWRRERVILRTKAFSQEVFRVTFSPVNEGRLLTSGMGHIRFWKMANTFTGLKLQGDIGKFGNIEISDIAAYTELPDGKVISGCEDGSLLMWDGNLIQFQIAQPEGRPCHDGAIEFIALEDRTLISAGADGIVKLWRFDDLEFAEGTEEAPVVEIQPEREIKIGDNVQIAGMLRGDDHWIVQSRSGGVYKLWLPSFDVELLYNFHAGDVTGVHASPDSHVAITTGVDGSVRCWDVLNARPLYARQFNSVARSLAYAPGVVDVELRTVLIGFDDGVVRCLRRAADGFQLHHVFKPHKSAVHIIAFSPDGATLATAAADGTIFFFSVAAGGASYAPIGFVRLDKNVAAASLVWDATSDNILVACGADVLEYEKPSANAYAGDRDTFEIVLEPRRFRIDLSVEAPPESDDEEEDMSMLDAGERRRRIKKLEKKKKKEQKKKKKVPRFVHPVAPDTAPRVVGVLYGVKPGTFLLALDGSDAMSSPADAVDDYIYEVLYECSWENVLSSKRPQRSIHLGRELGSVSTLAYTTTGAHLLIGFSSGAAQMRPTSGDGAADLDHHFTTQFHDSACLSLAVTYDERFLCSVGIGGNFFVSNVNVPAALALVDRSVPLFVYERPLREIIDEPVEGEEEEGSSDDSDDDRDDEQKRRDAAAEAKAEAECEAEAAAAVEAKIWREQPLQELTTNVYAALTLPATSGDGGGEEAALDGVTASPDVGDIVDAATYSIEEAKLKDEEDERVAIAEKKKAVVRAEIAQLRREFVELLDQNAALEPEQQLPREAFALDPRLRAQLQTQAREKVNAVREELAWISEKETRALDKVRSKFLGNLVCEHIKLHAFRTASSVFSFRVQELAPFLRDSIEKVHEMIASEEAARRELADKTAADGGGGDGGIGGGGKDNALKGMRATSKSAGGGSGGGGKRLSEAEQRKKARAERKQQLAQLKAAKPDKNVDDPRDVAAVQYAERNMGDYKLKSDPNYVVPEHQRVNAEKKRRQMILLQESVHYIKMALNERFLALRDLKRRIVHNVKRDNVRVSEINTLLCVDEQLWEPELDASEWPESREVFTKAELIAFEESENQRGDDANANSIYGSGDGGEDGDDADDDGTAKNEGKSGTTVSGGKTLNKEPKGKKVGGKGGAKGSKGETGADAATGVAGGAAAAGDNAATQGDGIEPGLSELEQAELAMARTLLRHEKRGLVAKINFAVDTFDQAVMRLRQEKLKLDTDLKTTDLKLLTLYQELHLLKEFEENENALFSKLSKARAAKSQVVADMTQCERQLCLKLEEIEAWQEKDKQVMQEFNSVVGGDKSEFYPVLLKIFKKKVNRNKKKKNRRHDDDGDDDDSDDDDYDSEDDNSDDDESSDEDDDDDSCPLNCESAVYEKVLELREKRLEQEEVLADFNKTVGELNKTYERHQGKERAIDKELASTDQEIEAFQSEKQRALNQIEVTVPLKLNQIKCLQQNRLPADISDCLIFTSTGLDRLRSRIVELGEEKSHLARQHRDLKRGHKVLLKEIQSKKSLIEIEKRKCEDVQMLKFGQIIDLSILEKVGVDQDATDLRNKLKQLELNSVTKLSDWDKKIQMAKDELSRVTQMNTQWLEKVASLTKAQYDLEDQLNTTTKNVHVADTNPLDERAEEERAQLLDLVQIQEKEIDALKAEIHVLRRKGGHVYIPK